MRHELTIPNNFRYRYEADGNLVLLSGGSPLFPGSQILLYFTGGTLSYIAADLGNAGAIGWLPVANTLAIASVCPFVGCTYSLGYNIYMKHELIIPNALRSPRSLWEALYRGVWRSVPMHRLCGYGHGTYTWPRSCRAGIRWCRRWYWRAHRTCRVGSRSCSLRSIMLDQSSLTYGPCRLAETVPVKQRG